MVLISSTTSPMRAAALDSSLTRSLVVRAWSTASLAMRADSCTWRLISVTEDDSSSVADATDCTLVEASSEAAATTVASCCARSAVEVSVVAEASSSVEADDTVSIDLADRALELVGKLQHVLPPLRCSPRLLRLFLLGFHADLGEAVLPEHFRGLGDLADLVLAVEAGIST